MPEKSTIRKARRDKEEGKSPSTQAGEFVREEMHHIREGKHGARSAKQAIAIGLSKAREAGVDIPDKSKGAKAGRGRSARRSGGTSATRSRATTKALKREGHSAASPTALSRQAHKAAAGRSASSRSTAAKKAARTKGAAGRSAAAKKAARTRAKG